MPETDTHPEADAPPDAPLDPHVEAVRRKMVRLLVWGGGVMALGFAALVVAVVYRLNAGDGSSASIVATPPVSATIALPEGAEVTGTAVSDARIALTLRLPDGRRLIRVHDTRGRLVVQYTLE